MTNGLLSGRQLPTASLLAAAAASCGSETFFTHLIRITDST